MFRCYTNEKPITADDNFQKALYRQIGNLISTPVIVKTEANSIKDAIRGKDARGIIKHVRGCSEKVKSFEKSKRFLKATKGTRQNDQNRDLTANEVFTNITRLQSLLKMKTY
ncbi:hypothetical protein Kpol_1075p8 [Vanderwaltozyma polyspora DSM 70294]|uniref:Uncharacterized protein n=1 Tax=Vanderwaltozyma polyspora (strain ATCC 22028 / DSM 70294 / BCRC 21397 / CBS 2163 / NBRC 10782 / NRRL Y-8283 / UCD 57-17) TaxID=436907 RepID=A7TSN6_VANPO|nr:uncharacterized protein Kpol_1075p8 [Vanderwaltozyma polyspora DSM 70294]EDO14730.1 hypothetical protein Kpol_1075p8 [Vanderwaltozyma polyspora DSM 70294]